jgi:hypothetical protein
MDERAFIWLILRASGKYAIPLAEAGKPALSITE